MDTTANDELSVASVEHAQNHFGHYNNEYAFVEKAAWPQSMLWKHCMIVVAFPPDWITRQKSCFKTKKEAVEAAVAFNKIG
jgi:hypothetical protein